MSFQDIIAQERPKNIILGQLRSGRIPHAYLFLGIDGIGRRKAALELSKSLNCHAHSATKTFSDACDHCVSCQKIAHGNHPDVQVIDFEYQAKLEGKDADKQRNIKIDTIRAVQKDISLKPTEGRWKVYIIDPAEKITLDAANCLLKTLEEPPSWTMIILLAKHKENLPATIVSRTQVLHFTPLPEAAVAAMLLKTADLPPEKARAVAAMAEGSLATALRLVDETEDVEDSPWKALTARPMPDADLLSLSQQHAKTAADVLDEMTAEAKLDFRADPNRFNDALASIMAARRMLERNASGQTVLDVLFLKLNRQIWKNP